MYKPVVRYEFLQQVICNALSQVTSQKETPDLKKKLMRRLTSKQVESRVFRFPKILGRKTRAKAKQNAFTLGRFVVAWAILTDQTPKDFAARVYPAINSLYRNWHAETGCSGFSNEDCLGHPRESAQFWSGFYRILIQETPEKNLNHFMKQVISSQGNVIESEGLDKIISELGSKASSLMTADAVGKIKPAFKANPSARDSLTTPEFKALVLWEENKLGWSENTDKEAVEILQESLSPELEEAATKKYDIIQRSMESISRRSLLRNLTDAVKGQLRGRLIESALRWLERRLLQKPWIIWDVEEGGDEVYKILMKEDKDGEG